jgi:hypothetical protein
MWRDINNIPPKDWKPNTKMLYTVATNNGWNRDGVHALIEMNFKKQSTKDLTFDEYNQVLEWLDSIPANTVTTGHDPNTDDFPF